VDTIEENPQHADLAEEAFQQRDLSRRINVIRGRGQNILPKLKGRYDIVFLDGDWREYRGTFRISVVSRVPAALS
jgi:predicted O-methyltransferase YrrM